MPTELEERAIRLTVPMTAKWDTDFALILVNEMEKTTSGVGVGGF
jgi:hypothetical protein